MTKYNRYTTYNMSKLNEAGKYASTFEVALSPNYSHIC